VIVGGESGPGARPMKKDWVLSIRNQCEVAGVALYFKRWGGTRKHLNGRVLDGRTYDAMPAGAERPASGLLDLEPSVAGRD
jgi:protein gp37